MPAYWAVLRSAPGHDVLAYEGVVRAGYEIFTPKIRTRVGAKWKTNPLFGCYFFARVIDQWRVLERTIGVLPSLNPRTCRRDARTKRSPR